MRRWIVFGGSLGLLLLLLGAAMAWWATAYYADLCPDSGCVDLTVIEEYRPAVSTVVLDRYGGELGLLYTENRRVLSLDEMPDHLPNAFLAIEDQRFYQHTGVDWVRVAGAAWENLKSQRVRQGASTITMQLARNLFPESLPYTERTFDRKLMEVRAARAIEQAVSKNRILEAYLNTVYLGSGAYGVDAASREYFGVPATDLTLTQATLLAGLPQAPNRLNPTRNPEGAMTRRNAVLHAMVEFGVLDSTDLTDLFRESLGLREPESDSVRRLNTAPYFLEAVRRELIRRYGMQAYRAGLKVHTGLDPILQGILESAIEEQLLRVESGEYGATLHPPREEGGDYLQSAAVALDAQSGDILAMVGGRDFSSSEFNRTTQTYRQPGSAMKPFVTHAALKAGVHPGDSISDGPVAIQLWDGSQWRPRNFSDLPTDPGWLTVSEALVRSRNRATVRLSSMVGIEDIARLSEFAGVADSVPRYPSIVLGSFDVRPIDLVSAYTLYAREDGQMVQPRLAYRVETREGRTLFSRPVRRQGDFDPALTQAVRNILRDVVEHGTGRAVRTAGYTGPVFGKTGTTNNSEDVWFIGGTPDLVIGVWVGADNPSRIIRGRLATGGSLVAPIVGAVLAEYYDADLPDWENVHALPSDRTACPDFRQSIFDEPLLDRLNRITREIDLSGYRCLEVSDSDTLQDASTSSPIED